MRVRTVLLAAVVAGFGLVGSAVPARACVGEACDAINRVCSRIGGGECLP